MEIGDRIRQLREQVGLTQAELAQKIGYQTKGTINKMENGNLKVTTDKLDSIAKALDTTPNELMGWEIDQVFTFTDIQNKLNNYDQLSDALIPFIDVEFDVSELDEILQYAKYVASKRD